MATDGHDLTDEDKNNLLAYPIGNVCCGLWRKSILTENAIRFPEHVFYEDNYWGCILKPYLGSVTFVQEVGYYYRNNPTSTTHLRDDVDAHKKDRIFIEDAIIRDAKSRGFYDIYKTAYDYGFIIRRCINTWHLCVNNYDDIDQEFLRGLMISLKNEIPEWERNPYYVELTGVKHRLMNKCIVENPVLMARLKKKAKKILRK